MSRLVRIEIPNLQVKDVASQFFKASTKLDVPYDGTAMPMLHCGAIAIELFLKLLSAEHEDIPEGDGWVVRYAKPTRGHTLAGRLASIDADVRSEIESAFREHCPGEELKDALSLAEGVFMPSRYPYEAGLELPDKCVGLVRQLSRFLSGYLADMDPREILLTPPETAESHPEKQALLKAGRAVDQAIAAAEEEELQQGLERARVPLDEQLARLGLKVTKPRQGSGEAN